jgi:pilus assembly protein CpaB
MHLLARGRHLLARRPWLYWLAAIVLAVGVGLAATRAASAVDDARARWGATRDVVVATAELVPGEPLAGRTEVRARPSPTVPATALRAVEPGAVARQHVAPGEVVVTGDVAATAAPATLVPDGWSAVAVAEAVPTGVAVGDRVGVAGGGVVLAVEGVVVGRPGEAVLVAVPDDEAAAVAAASSAGDVALLLRP